MDDLVQIRQGDQQPFQDMGPIARFFQLVFRTARNDHTPVIDKNLQSAF